jgi:hypothetical protein
LSPLTVSTKLARIAQASGRKVAFGRAATVMSPCGVVNCKVSAPQGPLLTNRMTELVTYGSLGGRREQSRPSRVIEVFWRTSSSRTRGMGFFWAVIAIVGYCVSAGASPFREPK